MLPLDGVRGFSFPEEVWMLAYSASEFRMAILDITSRAERHDLTKPGPASIWAYSSSVSSFWSKA